MVPYRARARATNASAVSLRRAERPARAGAAAAGRRRRFLFSGIVVRGFGGDDGARAIGATAVLLLPAPEIRYRVIDK